MNKGTTTADLTGIGMADATASTTGTMGTNSAIAINGVIAVAITGDIAGISAIMRCHQPRITRGTMHMAGTCRHRRIIV